MEAGDESGRAGASKLPKEEGSRCRLLRLRLAFSVEAHAVPCFFTPHMNSVTQLAKVLRALCVVALLLAQTMGATRNFICACSGMPEMTQADHCHGEHGVACDEADSSDEAPAQCPDSDRQDHARLDAYTHHAATSAHVIAPLVATLPAELPFDLWIPLEPPVDSPRSSFVSPPGSPRPSILVAHSVVLLI
jgi:hypothetical protein